MKIGIDARFFGPESKGLGRYTQKLVEHLERIDHTNDYVIFMMRDNIDLYKPSNPRFTKVLADYRWYSLQEQIFFPWKLYGARCDFIHFPHFNVPLLYWGKFIVTIHDLILMRFPTHRASTRSRIEYWFKFMMYRLVIGHAVHHARHIAAVSQFTKDDISTQYKINPQKVSVTLEAGSDVYRTHNDLQEKNLDNAELTETLGLGKDRSIIKSYLLYVGNAYPHKNLEVLVDAFALWKHSPAAKEHEDVLLVLVGKDDYFYQRLRTYICTRGISDIVILNTVPNKQLHEIYLHAQAFVFPSLYEGFGLPPLEACAYGVPVVSSEASCMPEILGDAVLYSDATCVTSFARGIERIMSDDDLRRTLRKRGPLQAQKYTWEETARTTHTLYSEIK